MSFCCINDQIKLAVIRFEYQAALSSLYSLKLITLLVTEPEGVKVGDAASFMGYSGFVSDITLKRSPSKRQIQLEVIIGPRLQKLSLQQSEIYFKKATIKEIIETLCVKQQKRDPGFQYECRFQTNYLTRYRIPMFYMGKQSDLSFIDELLNFGVAYYFEFTKQGDKVIFVDASHALPKQTKLKASSLSMRRVSLRSNKAIPLDRVPGQGAVGIQELKAKQSRLICERQIKFADKQQDYQSTIEGVLNKQNHDQQICYTGKESSVSLGVIDNLGIVVSVKIEGRFDFDRWDFTSIVIIEPTIHQPWQSVRLQSGFKTNIERLKDGLSTQVSKKGRYHVQLDKPFRFRDVQTTLTEGGGASFSTSLEADIVLASISGSKHAYCVSGALGCHDIENQIVDRNEQQMLIKNSGGLEVSLNHRRVNKPSGHIDLKLDQTITALGSGKINNGLTESTPGKAKYITAKDRKVVAGNGVYQHYYQAKNSSLSISVNVDQYEEQYFPTPGSLGVLPPAHYAYQLSNGVINENNQIAHHNVLKGGQYQHQHEGNIRLQHHGSSFKKIAVLQYSSQVTARRVKFKAKQGGITKFHGELYKANYRHYYLQGLNYQLHANCIEQQADVYDVECNYYDSELKRQAINCRKFQLCSISTKRLGCQLIFAGEMRFC